MHKGVPVRYGKPTRRRGSRFPIIMVIIIIILALLAGIYLVHGIVLNNDEEPQETVNTQQTEVVTEDKSVQETSESKAPVDKEPEAEPEDIPETEEQPTEPETKPEEQTVVTPEPENPAVTQPETAPETAPTEPVPTEPVPEPKPEAVQ